MKILAIETSCDDTGAAVLEAGGEKLKILSNIISSQVKLHAKYGGVYPFLAKREHQKNLPIVYKKAIKNHKIDAVAVTEGPGLEPCLWVGINFAKNAAEKLKTPLIPINHIEAHILANFIEQGPTLLKKNIFPAIALVVSGGHTQLILMKNLFNYKVLGETRDDAAGECFDKVARILNLGYPGGPEIEKRARTKQKGITLPRPMLNQKNYDFSFSGLKTAVLYNYKSQPEAVKKTRKYIDAMCYETQQAIIDVLLKKTDKAKRNHKAKTVILGGGVTANDELRRQFKKAFNIIMPDKKFCTDNAIMIAAAAYFHIINNKITKRKIEANGDLRL